MWKKIEGYNGAYEVNENGEVKSIDRVVTRSDGIVQKRHGRILSQYENKDGYLTVKLSCNGVSKYVFVHRIVAQTFITSNLEGYEINHLDFDRKNNHVSNLDVVTHTENISYTKSAGRHVSDRGFAGSNNPNYGNHKLSQRYRDDPSLAAIKQSRPGGKNGHARPIEMYYNGQSITFGCIKECAEYLSVILGLNDVSISWLSTTIRRKAEAGESYKGVTFRL